MIIFFILPLKEVQESKSSFSLRLVIYTPARFHTLARYGMLLLLPSFSIMLAETRRAATSSDDVRATPHKYRTHLQSHRHRAAAHVSSLPLFSQLQVRSAAINYFARAWTCLCHLTAMPTKMHKYFILYDSIDIHLFLRHIIQYLHIVPEAFQACASLILPLMRHFLARVKKTCS